MPWFDGAFHPTNIVPFDLADRGLLLGDGVFDTSLVLGRTMVWRAAHVQRLMAFCESLGFRLEAAKIDAAIDGVLAGQVDGALRITLTRGSAPRGVAPPREPRPTIFATLAPPPATTFAPVRLHPSAIRRNETSPTSRVKSLGYLDAVLASRDAIAAGYDDALFLNTRGHVACTATGNIFALFGDRLVTPCREDGAVAGVVRGVLLASGAAVGLEAIERRLTADELERADAVFATNSLRLLAPVQAIGGTTFGSTSSPRIEAMIAHLAACVRAETGCDPRPSRD